MQKDIVLYFIQGMTPTAAEASEAASLRAKIRNAGLAADAPVEHCTAVAGPAVPEAYADKPLVEGVKEEANNAEAAAGPATTLYEMTVKQLRAYAGEKGIQLPAHINTKEEITAHIVEHQG